MQSLRAAIVGTGFMARTHAKNLLADGAVEIAAVCSRGQESGRAFLETVGASGQARVYTAFEALLEAEPKLDLACVCLPPFAHDGEVVRAAEAGLHLFLEKPLALRLAQAEAMVAAIEAAGVVSQMCYQFRFRKSSRRVLELLAKGEAGRPTLFEGRFWVNMDGPAWWTAPEKSGGQLFEQVIHLYDLAIAFCGPPARIAARTANLCHREDAGYGIEDTSVAQLHFANGALGQISGSNCAIRERFIADWRLACEQLTLHSTSSGDWREPDRATLHFGPEKVETFTEDADAHAAAMAEFLQAVRGGGHTGAPARVGLDGVRLAHRALASAANDGTPLDCS